MITAAMSGIITGIPSKLSATPLPKVDGLQGVYDTDAGAGNLNKAYAAQRKLLPELRLMCDTPEAAQAAVNWTRDQGRQFACRGGGHCFMGFSQNADVVLDTRGMRNIQVDRATKTLRVGAGARLDIIYNAINPMGLSLAGGTFGGVGIAGHTLGGGFGARCRANGMLIDNLLAIEMVVANGQMVTASTTENTDLFWACRGGGGGQFGLATNFTFALQDRGPTHRIAIIESAGVQRTAEILYLWHYFTQNSPRHLTTHLQLGRRGNNGFLVQLTGLAEGNRDDLKEELRLLLRRKEPIHDNFITSNAPKDLAEMVHEGESTAQAHLLTQSHLLSGPLSEQGVAEVLTTILRHPDDAITVNFEPLGGAVADVAPDATAFPHRNAAFIVHALADVKQPEKLMEKQAAMDEMRRVLAQHAMGGVYANYPDLTLPNWGQAYWCENLARLKQVKQKWDPENLFRHGHSIAVA